MHTLGILIFAIVIMFDTKFAHENVNFSEISTKLLNDTLEFPKDEKKYKIIKLNSSSEFLEIKNKLFNKSISAVHEEPPMEFPNDHTKYRIIRNNITAIKLLLHNSSFNFENKEPTSVSKNPKLDVEFYQPTNNIVDKDSLMHHNKNMEYDNVVKWTIAGMCAVILLIIIVYIGFIKRNNINRHNSNRILINGNDMSSDIKYSEF